MQRVPKQNSKTCLIFNVKYVITVRLLKYSKVTIKRCVLTRNYVYMIQLFKNI